MIWAFSATSSVLILTSCAMAVDQSKFRTCSQTSFCRRHRGGHSKDLYKYKILEESVHFHIPSVEEFVEKPRKETGLWKSFQDRILGGSEDTDNSNAKDPFVKGPAPQLTGLLVNTASETSTGHKEKLEFSVHAMADGLVRLRITEVYQEAGTPFEKARVTYDELVLTPDTMIPAEHAQWIRPGDDYLTKLVDPATKDNYMALQYGDKKGEHGMVLLFRIDSFAAFLYREAELQGGPVVTFGEQQLTHFEIRRTKDSQGGPSNSAEDEKSEDTGDASKDGEGETKQEKEIVGYWEDGLAIYADGTREERKVEEDHRKLTEAELDREGK